MWEKAGAQGLLGIDTPAEQGGIGADILYSAITWEEQYVFAKVLSLFLFPLFLTRLASYLHRNIHLFV